MLCTQAHRNNTNYIGIMKRFEVGHEQDISDRKRFSFFAIYLLLNVVVRLVQLVVQLVVCTAH